MRWLLGLSLGYSKLQLAVGRGDGSPLRSVQREPINPNQEPAAIQLQMAAAIERFLKRAGISKGEIAGVGCGFRGNVDSVRGVIRGGPQRRGWENFPLAHWLTVNFDWPAVIFQDTEGAALAECAWGAGRGFDPLLYVHVGSQIEGALILGAGAGGAGAQPYRGAGQAADIGHLRPGGGPRFVSYPATTVNALASGVGIAQRAERTITEWNRTKELVEETFAPVNQAPIVAPSDRFGLLVRMAGPDLQNLSAETVAQAATQGDRLGRELLSDAIAALGWGIAQAITLFNPARVVIAGGLTRMPPELFFEPLKKACRSEASPQLASAWRGQGDSATGDASKLPPLEIVGAALSDAAALGGLLLAKRAFGHDPPLRAFSGE